MDSTVCTQKVENLFVHRFPIQNLSPTPFSPMKSRHSVSGDDHELKHKFITTRLNHMCFHNRFCNLKRVSSTNLE